MQNCEIYERQCSCTAWGRYNKNVIHRYFLYMSLLRLLLEYYTVESIKYIYIFQNFHHNASLAYIIHYIHPISLWTLKLKRPFYAFHLKKTNSNPQTPSIKSLSTTFPLPKKKKIVRHRRFIHSGHSIRVDDISMLRSDARRPPALQH